MAIQKGEGKEVNTYCSVLHKRIREAFGERSRDICSGFGYGRPKSGEERLEITLNIATQKLSQEDSDKLDSICSDSKWPIRRQVLTP